MKRRFTFALLLSAWAVVLGVGSHERFAAAQPAPAKPVKIVLLYTPPDHPPATHMYEFECRLLAACLEQTPGVKTEIHKVWPSDPATLDDAAAIVFYSNPAGDIVLAPERREKFLALMKKGVGFTAIHWAVQYSPADKTPDYMNILGGCFNFGFVNPPLAVTQERLMQADTSHPICRGWSEYEILDEWYLSMRWVEGAKPLLKVKVRADETQKRPQPIDLTVAWTYERPESNGGRSFGTSLGHFHHNFKIEAFRKMLVNGILWSARQEIPPQGSPVSIEPASLELPPVSKAP